MFKSLSQGAQACSKQAILAEQLEKGKAVGGRVNEYKTRLELLQAKRLQLRTQREAQGLVFTDQREQIITEEEFELLKQVGELETEFRQQFEEWEAVKQAVKYCRQMVDSSRARLVHEFENWYRICFFDAELRKPHTEVKDQEPSDETHHKVSTTGESFPRVQSAKVASFENVPQWEKYERAKEAVIQRCVSLAVRDLELRTCDMRSKHVVPTPAHAGRTSLQAIEFVFRQCDWLVQRLERRGSLTILVVLVG
ncbi:kinesin family member 6/9 [Clonorchis sinensis]|uniref:Kinesin family member 6/9 n=1 Tax=Clonorchis sinensis TaxID=79923 RepID=G7YVC1_CLOSI|nr:kinesin family member 6/9 [Clonorchis sinensis]